MWVKHKKSGRNFFRPLLPSTPLLFEQGIGVHLGINPTYKITEYFTIEGQVSYQFLRITSSFMSGSKGVQRSYGAIVGGRVYATPEKFNTRIFGNFMIGATYIDDGTLYIDLLPGFSVGPYVEFYDLVMVGVALEPWFSAVGKIGIKIPITGRKKKGN